ncbi:enterochelin esterase family protein [Salana multivorans]|uniref:Enterochelin esterase family protein n=1 Tax=Salana multivorans TaxID=120377 RepID=A0A3N2D1V5_9MICO|nr:alpha/beta hydrolase-fold protein [Salana multivorans]ROR93755.1 enterochelin esterase family protein [Salana multivorans]
MPEALPYRPMPLDLDDVRYEHGPDSSPRPGVAAGTTIELPWRSEVFPGTIRTIWIHVPAAYDPDEPAGLLVFQDGWWYLDPEGEIRAGIVLDNLVERGEIPVTIGVFVDPGVVEAAEDPTLRKNRNVEYDAFDNRYGRFLLEEVVPEVRRRLAITDDAERWGIVGGSSGGNCAVTVGWHFPERFRRVLGFVSSFAQIPGGNPYPELVRATPRKPLRILLQAAHRDLHWNEPDHNWLAENLRVAAALVEAGYDLRFVLGDGGHSPNHAGALMPDALRWLLRER